jgi:hypothetical protein
MAVHLTHSHQFLFHLRHDGLSFNVEKEHATGEIYAWPGVSVAAMIPRVNHSLPTASIGKPLRIEPRSGHSAVTIGL